jgi:hypothetical protein
MGRWNTKGKVAKITKKRDKLFAISIAENRYRIKDGKKESEPTIFYNCIANFEPTCQVNDVVLVEGHFLPAHNTHYQFTLVIDSIGKV